ncbi:MAG: hypothetical protein LBI69_00855 [Puniceicoccales bacterium]|jgi:hypothetical protein|nr:hypothetical protein [Puniceicoccales bacterium]
MSQIPERSDPLLLSPCAQQLQGKDANPTDNALGITNSQTSAHAPSLLRRMIISVACTLLATALGAGIAIAVMTFLLAMPIVPGIVVIAALGSASLTAGGVILWNVYSIKNAEKDSNPSPVPQHKGDQRHQNNASVIQKNKITTEPTREANQDQPSISDEMAVIQENEITHTEIKLVNNENPPKEKTDPATVISSAHENPTEPLQEKNQAKTSILGETSSSGETPVIQENEITTEPLQKEDQAKTSILGETSSSGETPVNEPVPENKEDPQMARTNLGSGKSDAFSGSENLLHNKFKEQLEVVKKTVDFRTFQVGAAQITAMVNFGDGSTPAPSQFSAMDSYCEQVATNLNQCDVCFQTINESFDKVKKKMKSSNNRQLISRIGTCMKNLKNEKITLDHGLISSNPTPNTGDAATAISSHATSFNELCTKMDHLVNVIICIDFLISNDYNQSVIDTLLSSISDRLDELELTDSETELVKLIEDQAKEEEFNLALSNFVQWTNELVPKAPKGNAGEINSFEAENYRTMYRYFESKVNSLGEGLKLLKCEIEKLDIGIDQKNPKQVILDALDKISFQCRVIERRKNLVCGILSHAIITPATCSKSAYFKNAANEIKALQAEIININEIISLGTAIIKSSKESPPADEIGEKFSSFESKIKEMDKSINAIVDGLAEALNKIYAHVNNLNEISIFADDVNGLKNCFGETDGQLSNLIPLVDTFETSAIDRKLEALKSDCITQLILRQTDKEIENEKDAVKKEKNIVLEEINKKLVTIEDSMAIKFKAITEFYKTLSSQLTGMLNTLKQQSEELKTDVTDSRVSQFKNEIRSFSNEGKTLKEFVKFLHEKTEQLKAFQSKIPISPQPDQKYSENLPVGTDTNSKQHVSSGTNLKQHVDSGTTSPALHKPTVPTKKCRKRYSAKLVRLAPQKWFPIKNLSQAVFKWFTGDTCPLKGTILNLLIDQDSLKNLQSDTQFIETRKNKLTQVSEFFKQEKNYLEKHVDDKNPLKAAIVQSIKAQGITQIENLQATMEKLEKQVEAIGATSDAIDVNSVEDYVNQFNALCFNAYCLSKTISYAIEQIENVKFDLNEESLKNIADQVKNCQFNKNPCIESSSPLINLENIVLPKNKNRICNIQ